MPTSTRRRPRPRWAAARRGAALPGTAAGAGRRTAGRADAPRMIDAGCGAGRSSFALAARHPDALVLGCDLNLALLRLARRVAAEGWVRYARRRIGLAYDRRDFAAALPGAERVDYWACDATCLPFAPGGAAVVSALNLFDCVPDPPALLAALAAQLAPGGRLLLATPMTGRPGRRRCRAGSAAIPSAGCMAGRRSRRCGRCSPPCRGCGWWRSRRSSPGTPACITDPASATGDI
ncbi:methyltransferase domain-containing protein [Siccirubricoccus deserti]